MASTITGGGTATAAAAGLAQGSASRPVKKRGAGPGGGSSTAAGAADAPAAAATGRPRRGREAAAAAAAPAAASAAAAPSLGEYDDADAQANGSAQGDGFRAGEAGGGHVPGTPAGAAASAGTASPFAPRRLDLDSFSYLRSRGGALGAGGGGGPGAGYRLGSTDAAAVAAAGPSSRGDAWWRLNDWTWGGIGGGAAGAAAAGLRVGAGAGKDSWPRTWDFRRTVTVSTTSGYGGHPAGTSLLDNPVVRLLQHPWLSSLLALSLAVMIGSLLLPSPSPPSLWSMFSGAGGGSGGGRQGPAATAVALAELRRGLEALEKRTDKVSSLLQVQTQALAKKVEGVAEAQELLRRQVEQQGEALEARLQALGLRADDMDRRLKALLEEGGPVMRQQVLELVEGVLKSRGITGEEGGEGDGKEGGGSGRRRGAPLSLDEVREAAQRVVELELSKHMADSIAREDFVVGTAGGRVVGHSPAFPSSALLEGWGGGSGGTGAGGLLASVLPVVRQVLRLSPLHPHAQLVLQPRSGTPGRCLPLRGPSGSVDVALRSGAAIVVGSVSIEHVAKSVAFDVRSAPREFEVYGTHVDSTQLAAHTASMAAEPGPHHRPVGEAGSAENQASIAESVHEEGAGGSRGPDTARRGRHEEQQQWLQWRLLGRGSYDVDGSPVQTFELVSPRVATTSAAASQAEAEAAAAGAASVSAAFVDAVNLVRFRFLSNHGHPNYTCIYRLRVHRA